MANDFPLQPNEANPPLRFGLVFWALVVLVGLLSGLAGAGLMQLLYAVIRVAWDSTGDFLARVRAAPWERHTAVLAVAGCLVAALRLLQRTSYISHTGDLTSAIWFRAGRVPFFSGLARAVVMICVVGLGAAVGREGAAKQAGTAIATKLSDLFHLSRPQRRLLAVCGAAAGFAAVYDIPIGAALLGLEVFLGTLSVDLVTPVLLSTVVASRVARPLLPVSPFYIVADYAPSAAVWGWACFAALPLAGSAVLYTLGLAWLDRRRLKFGAWVWLAPALVLLGLGAISMPLPELLGNGKPLVQECLSGSVPFGVALLLTVCRPLATDACLAAGVPGGLFTPTLAFGAVASVALARVYTHLVPGTSSAPLVVMGMAAVLSGTFHAPLAAVALVLELTQDVRLAVPLMAASALSLAISRRLYPHSLYSERLREHMAAAAPPAISSAAGMTDVSQRLLGLSASQSLIVLGEDGELVGRLDRGSLQRLPPRARSGGYVSAGDIAR